VLGIDLLPAARGDSLWIEYGRADRPHRILIDGGILSTGTHLRERIERLPVGERRFDLLVITHVDLDHIAGVLALLRDPPEGLAFDDVWFNGWRHLAAAQRLADDGVLGAKLGERLSARLEQRGYQWNAAFGGGPAMIADPPDGEEPVLPRHTLAGGMTLTLLSPTAERLRRLLPVWEKEMRKAGLDSGSAGEAREGIGHPDEIADEGILGDARIDVDGLARTPFRDDTSAANGSSIALLAEFDGRRCLLMGDAHASDAATSIGRVIGAERDGDLLEIDALKLSHHGGRKNTSPALLRMLRCPRYLFSTDGSVYDHPHAESVARVLVHGARGAPAGRPTLVFNYRSAETSVWDDAKLFHGTHAYEPAYPDDGAGIRVEL
jgi:hypothetical protein